jgi:uncharacterized protein YjbJ (UPF0337 family)
MNWNQIKGKWKQLKGRFREKWGKLTDDDLDVIKGKRDQLVGKIQELYGLERGQAQREVEDFVRTLRAEDATEEESAKPGAQARRAGES